MHNFYTLNWWKFLEKLKVTEINKDPGSIIVIGQFLFIHVFLEILNFFSVDYSRFRMKTKIYMKLSLIFEINVEK